MDNYFAETPTAANPKNGQPHSNKMGIIVAVISVAIVAAIIGLLAVLGVFKGKDKNPPVSIPQNASTTLYSPPEMNTGYSATSGGLNESDEVWNPDADSATPTVTNPTTTRQETTTYSAPAYNSDTENPGSGYYMARTKSGLALRMRAQRSTESEVVGFLLHEEVIYVIKVVDGWGYVNKDGTYGWVSMEFMFSPDANY